MRWSLIVGCVSYITYQSVHNHHTAYEVTNGSSSNELIHPCHPLAVCLCNCYALHHSHNFIHCNVSYDIVLVEVVDGIDPHLLILTVFSIVLKRHPSMSFQSAEEWLLGRIGETPLTSLGWFRAGVGFYNKHEFNFSIECFQRAIDLDPINVCRTYRTVVLERVYCFVFDNNINSIMHGK
jgi:hypothetical protein